MYAACFTTNSQQFHILQSDDESEVAEDKPTTTEAKPVAESKAEKAPKLSKQHLLEILDALFSKTEELHVRIFGFLSNLLSKCAEIGEGEAGDPGRRPHHTSEGTGDRHAAD